MIAESLMVLENQKRKDLLMNVESLGGEVVLPGLRSQVLSEACGRPEVCMAEK